jgi:hypothetical protein
MLKYLIVLCCFILNSILFSQKQIISGAVYSSKDSIPIEYASIFVSNHSIGAYSNSDGNFKLQYDSSLKIDTIVVSQIGYFSKAYSLHDKTVHGVVYLDPDSLLISQVNIIRNKKFRIRNKKLAGWKNKTNTSISSSAIKGNLSIAQFVKNAYEQEGYIKSVEIFLSSMSKNREPFRLNVLDLDISCSCPGKSLMDRQVVIEKGKSGWNRVDLEDQFIELPKKGFFIVYEHISPIDIKEHSHAIGFISKHGLSEQVPFTRQYGGKWERNQSFSGGRGRLLLVKARVKIFDEP